MTHPAARVLDLPLLHELRRHGRRARAARLDRRARGDRRLRAGRGRPAHAEGARAHRRARARDRAVRRRRRPLAARRRRHARAGPAAHASASASRSRSAASWPWSPARAWRSCSRRSAPRRCPAARRSTPRPTSCWPGIHDVPAEEVVVLPNSANVVMAAERAAELSDKKVVVVPTRSQQAGLAAAVALDPDARRRGQRRGDARRAGAVRTGAVTAAARDDAEARFRRGDAVGFVDEQLVAWGGPSDTLEAVLGELGTRGRAADPDRRGRRAAGRRRTSPRSCRTASSSSTPGAASPPTGG